MPRTTTSPALFCSLTGAAILSLAPACGKKGDPLPPLRPIPAAAEEVSLRQVGDEVRLQWKAPNRNQDGSTEGLNLEKARVLRRVLDVAALVAAQAAAAKEPVDEEPQAETSAAPKPPPSAPPPTIPPFDREAVVAGELESRVPGESRFYEEPIDPSWIGKRIQYAVVYVNGKNRTSPASTLLSIDPGAPLPAPGAPGAEAEDGFVAVGWSPPAFDRPVQYRVFRRLQGSESYPDSPLNPEPLSTAKYEDRAVVFGAPSCYVVQAVLTPLAPAPEETPAREESPDAPQAPIVLPIANTPPIESPLSDEVCLTPEDVFPPLAPSGLVAVPSPEGIHLSWSEVEAPDLKGYRVYRGESSSGPFQLLGDVDSSSYTDESAGAGESYFYAVTAFDRAPGANESGQSNVVEATRPQ